MSQTNTQTRIINAFLELARTKEIQQITVTELCQKADINRSTFYARYPSLEEFQHVALVHLTDSLFEEATQDIDVFTERKIARKVITRVLERIKAEKDVFKKFYTSQTFIDFRTTAIADKMFRHTFTLTYDEQQKNQAGSAEQNAFGLTFFKYGVNGILNEWVRDNCKTPVQEIADYTVYYLHRLFEDCFEDKL